MPAFVEPIHRGVGWAPGWDGRSRPPIDRSWSNDDARSDSLWRENVLRPHVFLDHKRRCRGVCGNTFPGLPRAATPAAVSPGKRKLPDNGQTSVMPPSHGPSMCRAHGSQGGHSMRRVVYRGGVANPSGRRQIQAWTQAARRPDFRPSTAMPKSPDASSSSDPGSGTAAPPPPLPLRVSQTTLVMLLLSSVTAPFRPAPYHR